MNRRELLKLSSLLLGTAACSSVSRAIMAGVITNPETMNKVFSDPQKATVNLLSEMIIPTTDTPGAITAGVPDFIATIVGDWYNETEREIFFNGLKSLDQHCLAAEDKVFHLAGDATRKSALDAEMAAAREYKATPSGSIHPMAKQDDSYTPFFTKLKELVVLGYYTSETGAKQELIYLPMPGYYDGEFEFAKVGRQWIS